MSQRFGNWQSRLHALIRERSAVAFEWGRQDCCLFPAACIQAVTGRTDVIEPFGTWSDERGAARAIKAAGGLRAAVSSRLGEEITPLMAQAGDVGMFLEGERECLAVWAGSAWLATGEKGLVIVRRAALMTAWRCTGEA